VSTANEQPEPVKPSATRRSPRGESRRALILDAAAEEFAAHGYHGASIAAIAEKAGISQSGVLHHFASKDILLDAVVQSRFGEDAAIVDRLGLGNASPFAGYDTLMSRNTDDRVWVQFLMVIMAEGLTENNPAHELIRVRYERVKERMKQRLLAHAGDEFDVAPNLDRGDLVVLFLAVLDGLQLQWLYDDSVDMRRVVRLMVELVTSYTQPLDPQE
jgi:AcrR family transcriptional regulator